MPTLQLQVEEPLLSRARATASEMGLDLDSAVRLFLSQMVRDNALPFLPKIHPAADHGEAGKVRPVRRLGFFKDRLTLPDDLEDPLPPEVFTDFGKGNEHPA